MIARFLPSNGDIRVISLQTNTSLFQLLFPLINARLLNKTLINNNYSSTAFSLSQLLCGYSHVMPEDKEQGTKNPRINRWLEGVETAINEGTLYGVGEEERSVSKRKKHLFFHTDYPTDYRHGI